MTVLETIEEYISYINSSSQKRTEEVYCISLLYDYCKYKEAQLEIEELDESFFDKFFLYWLPIRNKMLSGDRLYYLFPSIKKYYKYLRNNYKIKELNLSKSLDKFIEEFIRIINLSKAFSRFLGNPVISVDPLIVDLRCYKESKLKKSIKERNGVFEQGYFEVIDISPDCSITIKKKPKGRYAKILLDDDLVLHLKKGDILQLKITRRLFFTYWEIEEIKSCYLKEATKYLLG
ncbi:MAG: hypothetical protein GX327_04580 [Epulopiscium sp.]|nr:hypothetical protein [Candidatus Epulonipiscium sp.]